MAAGLVFAIPIIAPAIILIGLVLILTSLTSLVKVKAIKVISILVGLYLVYLGMSLNGVSIIPLQIKYFFGYY